MKRFSLVYCTFILFVLASCTSNDEPNYPVFMQPSSIQSLDANADNQTFEYDAYGRIVSWNCISNSKNDASYSAHFFYPDENTIKVTAEEVRSDQQRIFEETIQLKNGRASNSEGTLISIDNGVQQFSKTYRLVFDYLPSNHLNIVGHSEVFGIAEDLKENAWDKAMKWENYLIWENGNLKEYQDFQGNSSLFQTTKYEYSLYAVACPIEIPMVINSAHHLPLCMQGVFGLNSFNLVKSSSTFDYNSNLIFSWQYSYEFERARISKYTSTRFTNSVLSNPVTYTVNWTEK